MSNTQNKNIEAKKEFLKNSITQYINKFNEKNLINEVKEYEALRTAIDFSESESSLNMVEHLYDIRFNIEEHIISKNFNNKYKKLNEKLNYQMNKMIKKIYTVDISDSRNIYKISIFKDDVSYITSTLNKVA